MSKVKNAYFGWLYDHVKNDHMSYLKLSKYLDRRPFYWTVPNDGNRQEDCIREREIFLDTISHGLPNWEQEKLLTEPVSLFEVMVALCKRIDYNLDDMVSPPRLDVWYELLLTNVGLTWATDNRFPLTRTSLRKMDEILTILLGREYGYNGNGSFFPVKHNHGKSMAETEIWYQMMAYLEENY